MIKKYFCLECEQPFTDTENEPTCSYCGSNSADPSPDYDESHFEGDFASYPNLDDIED